MLSKERSENNTRITKLVREILKAAIPSERLMIAETPFASAIEKHRALVGDWETENLEEIFNAFKLNVFARIKECRDMREKLNAY